MRVRAEIPDKRWRGERPVPAPAELKTLTRDQVAAKCGVSTRTVSRWADQGILTKYLDVMHRVVFSVEQTERIVTARLSTAAPPEPDPPRSKQTRW